MASSNSKEINLPNAETVHRAFRGASEVAKTKIAMALSLEVIAVAISLAVILNSQWNSLWVVLASLFCAVVPAVLRVWADHNASLAQRWRREAMRAYIGGQDLSSATGVQAKRRMPWLSEHFASKLPATTLHAYYESRNPPGLARQHETYACSALYTASLLKVKCLLNGIALAVLAVATFVAFIVFFDSAPSAQYRFQLIQVLCSVIIAIVAVRILETTVQTFFSWRAAEEIVGKLIETPDVDALKVEEACQDYDFDRTSCPSAPTWLYKLMRNRIEMRWDECYRAIAESWRVAKVDSVLKPASPPTAESRSEGQVS